MSRSLPMRCWLLLFLTACGGSTTTVAPDGGPDPIGQGAEPRGDFLINEVSPRPSEGPDWIELANRGSEAIDLCDYFVTDSLDRLDHYYHLAGAAPPAACTPTLLGPGEYMVVIADDDSEAHFRLGQADEVHIVSTAGRAVDSLIYLQIEDDGSTLAREPDLFGLFFPAPPSPGEANLEQPL